LRSGLIRSSVGTPSSTRNHFLQVKPSWDKKPLTSLSSFILILITSSLNILCFFCFIPSIIVCFDFTSFSHCFHFPHFTFLLHWFRCFIVLLFHSFSCLCYCIFASFIILLPILVSFPLLHLVLFACSLCPFSFHCVKFSFILLLSSPLFWILLSFPSGRRVDLGFDNSLTHFLSSQ
jgi:hypothetical protein